jgi:4-hydroxybenzoate polyprenyltransferase
MLQLIRWKNLLFLAVLQTLMFFGVLKPILAKYTIALPYEYPIFGLLLGATLFIAAGGYIVNDYFDTKIDQINKPTKVIVGNTISRNAAGWAFQICFAIGIACGIALAIILGKRSRFGREGEFLDSCMLSVYNLSRQTVRKT